MAVLRYRDYYFCFAYPDKFGTFSYIPIVEIRHKRDNNPAARLVLTEAFATFTEARAQGLAAGKKWVDEDNPERKSVEAQDESGKKAQNKVLSRALYLDELLILVLRVSNYCCKSFSENFRSPIRQK